MKKNNGKSSGGGSNAMDDGRCAGSHKLDFFFFGRTQGSPNDLVAPTANGRKSVFGFRVCTASCYFSSWGKLEDEI